MYSQLKTPFFIFFFSLLALVSNAQVLDSSITSEYDNGVWIKEFKTYYNYTSFGKNSLVETTNYGNQQNFSRLEYSYDSNQDLSHIYFSLWNNTNSSWDTSQVEIFQRGTQGKVQLYLKQNRYTGNWVTTLKDSNIYNSSGILSERYSESRLASGQLYEKSKQIQRYNANGLLDTLLVETWDQDSLDWFLKRAHVYSYDAQDSLLSDEQFRVLTNQNWIEEFNIETSYDQKNLAILRTQSFFRGGFYVTTRVDSLSNYSFGKVDVKTTQIVPRTNAPLEYIERNKYYYSGQGVSVDENEQSSFKLFPNPAHDILQIHCENCDEYFSIIDLSGRIVLQSSSDNKTIDVSGLPGGYYQIKSGSSVGQFMIK